MLIKSISLVDENYNVQHGMNVVISNEKIEYIGKEIPKDYKGDTVDGGGKLAMPGFYNAHCHVPMSLMRGYGEGLSLYRWLNEKMFPFEALMVPEDMYWGALLGISEMISSGAVSFSDMYMEMEGICKAVEESGVKANLSHGTSSGQSPEVHYKDVGRGWRDMQYLLDYTKNVNHSRIIPDMGIHSEYTSNETLIRGAAEFAIENNLRLQVHLSETKKEHEECKSRRGGRTPTQWLEYCGVLEVPVTAAHCVWLEDGDFDILARKKVTIAHCPSSNLKLGSGIAPVKKMMEKGIPVAIGTDGAASNNNLNMLEEVNLAAMVQKGANQDPLFLSTKDVLNLACKNGALSQGREDCGVLKVGNKADIIIFDMDKPHLTPRYDDLSNILYSAQSSDICMTIIDGRVVYKNGEFTTIDIEKVKHNARRIKEEKLSKLG